MTTPLVMCPLCKHYKGGDQCDAFQKIPIAIAIGEHDHRKPYPGDNGIRYETVDKGGDAR